MKNWELLPVNDGGFNVTDDRYSLSCAASEEPICTVEFFNAGTNSIVRINYGGITRLLPVGAAWAVTAPAPAFPALPHLTTEFKIEFVNGGGAAAQTNNCAISTQKYILT